MADKKRRILVELEPEQDAQIDAFIRRQTIMPSISAVLRAVVVRGLPLVVGGRDAAIADAVATLAHNGVRRVEVKDGAAEVFFESSGGGTSTIGIASSSDRAEVPT